MNDVSKNCRNQTFYTWGVQSNFSPEVISSASGCHLYTSEGEKVLDLSSQLVLTNIGFENKRVSDAINKQMEKFHFIAPYFASEIRDLASAELLKVLPNQMDKVFYTLGGADANENAIKIAQLFTGKTKIVTRYRSYHGGTYLASQLGGDPRRHLSPTGIPWVVRIQDSGIKDEKELARQIEQTIILEGPDTIAAVMLEGYSGSSGIYQPQTDYFWKKLQSLCKEHNIIIIFDEIMSGFGRTGKWFGHEHFPIEADIITMAKGLTSGYLPLGAVGVRKEISRHFEENNFNCGLTYNSHAASLAASLEVLKIYQEDNLIKRSEELGIKLKEKLSSWCEKYDFINDTRGTGLLQMVEFNFSEWNKPQSDKMKKLIASIRKKSIHVFSRWNYLFITPPLVISWEELEDALGKIEQCLDEV